MNIKPRIGAKLEFSQWALFGNAPPENQLFTGILTGRIKGRDGSVIYIVTRDFDGDLQTVPRETLIGYAKED